ncbi:bifunctional hydroxymethylpyrimidine kinase/phosphomethylpyrimidine kinase [Cryobacterium sp. TMT1-62]|nr:MULTISPECIES: bifunctional hydroxymethylpyrimidine kinase/phosphomethylpyrimidine kinase [unclassified Cryobacterium]TFB54833.1 bifunctional hydroxymethylpyrimidine kinase/phosphomethylpyrimidine kinase [Cryobacterium sp. Sr3]TFC50248.1 bifunctional hydroxymethylpyrimidine kinase/phosphomethylpyrimidine kinase [Cryobacterium sp. TMT2-17-1]TFC64750.1 bifunctional hydroxymethylpyrimidine kinase/phosphomethylpyrimidine kinase [Cryobacterium sp. TMT2-4]TFD31099.1 bifunctional hydroxymethylpyrimi
MTGASPRIARVLSIAGTDPTGGAGIQADLKSIAANGGYGMAVVTALVAQNTHGVRSVHVPPVSFLREQLHAVSDDVDIDAVKIGMLADVNVTRTVSGWLGQVKPGLVVLDPVMIATSGDRLLTEDAEEALRDLLSVVHLVTPNIPELAILVGSPVATSWSAVLRQAQHVAETYGVLVLAKGGHLAGDLVPDALVGAHTVREFPGLRIDTPNTHGTGCSFSSAVATRVAARAGTVGPSLADWGDAVAEAKLWLSESIAHSGDLQVGSGHGPIQHFAGLWQRGGLHTSPSPAQVAEEWWHDIRDIRTDTDELPFIRALGDGSLNRDAFIWYLAQDALYLRDYARMLAVASRLAPTATEQAFWAASAHGAIAAELDLHSSWIAEETLTGVQPSDTTTAYLNHLSTAGASGDYGVLAAALLPCFWMYQDVGTRLYPLSHDAHPYRSWLDTYADEEFAASTARAIKFVTAAAAAAAEPARRRMAQAFRASAAHEREFFAAPLTNPR